jgi:tRNA (cmo5U34)-methyltransferase
MKDRWEEPEFARQWDAVSSRQMTGRTLQLELLMTLLEEHYEEGSAILDLGIGSGQVEELIFGRLPEARVVGVDVSPAMLTIARQRLAPFGTQCKLIEHDFQLIESLKLPAENYRTVISVLALHHTPHEVQQRVYRFLGRLLQPGSLFVHIERVALDEGPLDDLYRAAWRYFERERLSPEELQRIDFLEELSEKEDDPATLAQHLSWLHAAGFVATCLHLQLNRAVIIAVKDEPPTIRYLDGAHQATYRTLRGSRRSPIRRISQS